MKRNGIFTKRTISNMIVVVFGVLLYLALSNFASIRSTAGWFFNILSPFVIGIGMAYLLNLPMRLLENKVYRRFKRRRGLAILTVYLGLLVLLGVLVGLVLPQLGQSVVLLVNNIGVYINNFDELLRWVTETFHLDEDTLDFIAVSYTDIVSQAIEIIRTALPQVLDYTVSLASSIVSVLTAFIASLYMLISKDKLLVQTRRVVYAVMPKKRADEVYRVGRLSNQVFSGFISGKLLDSLIIGIICWVFMTVMNLWVYEMPYAPLISVIIGITNIIPFFGPFIGAIPSVMILLLVNPLSALWFIIFIIVLQQFDGNILGPKILGDATGLPALWVLIAIVVGGGLFGFIGMLLGVPTAAVLYTLASDVIDKRLKKRGFDSVEDIPTPPEDPTGPPDGGTGADNDIPPEQAPATSTSMEADKGMD